MKIIYVEDIELNAKLLSVLVRTLWKTTMTVSRTAEDGIFKILDQNFDLVFMDISLPGMSGIDAVRVIREHYSKKELPIIMVSAHVDKATIDSSLMAGANDYLTKPINVNKLRQTTDHYIQYADV